MGMGSLWEVSIGRADGIASGPEDGARGKRKTK